MRNPRRAYDAEGRELQPMTIADMRGMGIDRIAAFYQSCDHQAIVEAVTLPIDLPVPDVALKLRYSACISKMISTRPDWSQYSVSGAGRRLDAAKE